MEKLNFPERYAYYLVQLNLDFKTEEQAVNFLEGIKNPSGFGGYDIRMINPEIYNKISGCVYLEKSPITFLFAELNKFLKDKDCLDWTIKDIKDYLSLDQKNWIASYYAKYFLKEEYGFSDTDNLFGILLNFKPLFSYSLEEVRGIRNNLIKGGLVFVDDFYQEAYHYPAEILRTHLNGCEGSIVKLTYSLAYSHYLPKDQSFVFSYLADQLKEGSCLDVKPINASLGLSAFKQL